MVRALARATQEQRVPNLQYGIQLKRTRPAKPKDGEDPPARSEIKIMFSPLYNVKIDISRPPPDEDWTKLVAKDGTPYNPTQNLEFEILDCFLRHGLPDDGYPTELEKAGRKRRATDEAPRRLGDIDHHISPSKVKGRKRSKNSGTVSASSMERNSQTTNAWQVTDPESVYGRTTPSSTPVSLAQTSGRSNLVAAASTFVTAPVVPVESRPSRSKFQIPRIIPAALYEEPPVNTRLNNNIIDLDDSDSGSEASLTAPLPARKSALSLHDGFPTMLAASTPLDPDTTTLSVGSAIDPSDLRARRQNVAMLQRPPSFDAPTRARLSRPARSEVIDLT